MCVWQSREIGRKLFATDGSFPGFSSAATLACRQSFAIFLVSVQLLKKRSSQSPALSPNCLISSVWMSSRPGALPFFSTLMPMSSSDAVNALVNHRSLDRQGALSTTWTDKYFGCCRPLHYIDNTAHDYVADCMESAYERLYCTTGKFREEPHDKYQTIGTGASESLGLAQPFVQEKTL